MQCGQTSDEDNNVMDNSLLGSTQVDSSGFGNDSGSVMDVEDVGVGAIGSDEVEEENEPDSELETANSSKDIFHIKRKIWPVWKYREMVPQGAV